MQIERDVPTLIGTLLAGGGLSALLTADQSEPLTWTGASLLLVGLLIDVWAVLPSAKTRRRHARENAERLASEILAFVGDRSRDAPSPLPTSDPESHIEHSAVTMARYNERFMLRSLQVFDLSSVIRVSPGVSRGWL